MVFAWVRDARGLRLWMAVAARDWERRGDEATPKKDEGRARSPAPRFQTNADGEPIRNDLKYI